jgi:hypothetical protein
MSVELVEETKDILLARKRWSLKIGANLFKRVEPLFASAEDYSAVAVGNCRSFRAALLRSIKLRSFKILEYCSHLNFGNN